MENSKPFVKWAGGKSLLLPKIVKYFPKIGDTFHDIFLGGGSVLIHILKNRKPNNEEEARLCRENYYFYIRNLYNKKMREQHPNNYEIILAAYFIFLNKCGFRGLHREGPNGFNIPYGNYKNPCVYDEKNIDGLHELFTSRNVEFKHMNFTDSISLVNKNTDFMYLDPPYVPIDATSFVGYNRKGFNKNMYIILFQMAKENGNFIMSNSNAGAVLSEFSSEEYEKMEIVARRAIHSKKPGSVQIELLIIPKNLVLNN
jgi:DNA adenine methylase